jgi:two-component system response regulator RegA
MVIRSAEGECGGWRPISDGFDGAPRHANLSGMEPMPSLLIIDDDADVLEAAQLALWDHAMLIDAACSLDAAEDHMRQTDYDCVLLDMNFATGRRSGAEGIDALDRIGSIDPMVSVVMMTAYGAVTLAVASLKAGAHDFLLKPWKNDALIAAVSTAATRTRTMRAPTTLDALERSALIETLQRHKGNLTQAARSLGLSRPALYRRIAKHGL